jgi:hypothetical protein
MTAVGCAPDRSEVEPPPLAGRIHVNVLCRNKFSGLPTHSSAFVGSSYFALIDDYRFTGYR